MSAIQLTVQQQQGIQSYLPVFRSYLASDAAASDDLDRHDRARFFQHDLPERLAQLSEADVVEVVGLLWATALWGNKQYYAQQIISDNGLDRLRDELTNLLQGGDPPARRYDRFANRIKHMGPAATSEMLSYVVPDQCGIWNNRARRAITILGLEGYVNPQKYRLSAAEYERFNSLLAAIASELASAGVPDPDHLVVNSYLYEVVEHPVLDQQPVAQVALEPATDFDHDEIRDLVRDIGAMLGFRPDTEVTIAHGARVDVVWRASIGNLGAIEYVFEIHRSGSIDSLLLNLQRAKSSPTVQRVIAVSDEKQLDRIRRECEGLPSEFSKSLALWPVSDVFQVGDHLQAVSDSVSKLGLFQGP